MQIIEIHTPSIRLDQFLKWAGLAGTGGEAKQWILGGRVLVNGQVESRRGRTLDSGALIEVVGLGVFRCQFNPDSGAAEGVPGEAGPADDRG